MAPEQSAFFWIFQKSCIDNISSKSQKRQRLIAFDTIQYPRILKNNIYHSEKLGPPPFFHLDTNPGVGHVPIHCVGKTHVLVVTVEFIWLLFLNILSFNFVPTPNKSLRLTRFRRNYVNRAAIVATNHTSYAAFLLNVRCAVQSGYVPFFTAVCPQWWYICVTYFCWAHLLLELC